MTTRIETRGTLRDVIERWPYDRELPMLHGIPAEYRFEVDGEDLIIETEGDRHCLDLLTMVHWILTPRPAALLPAMMDPDYATRLAAQGAEHGVGEGWERLPEGWSVKDSGDVERGEASGAAAIEMPWRDQPDGSRRRAGGIILMSALVVASLPITREVQHEVAPLAAQMSRSRV